MRPLALLFALSLAACSESAPQASLPLAPGPVASVSGRVVERVDAVPYSYLRIQAERGQVWVAVPMNTASRGGKVTITHGVAVKDFQPPGLGRKL